MREKIKRLIRKKIFNLFLSKEIFDITAPYYEVLATSKFKCKISAPRENSTRKFCGSHSTCS